jgi:hypothetical protein
MKSRHREIALIVGLLLGLALASGCRPDLLETEQWQTIMQSMPGCAAPCWFGIVPGQTAEIELGELFAAAPDHFHILRYIPDYLDNTQQIIFDDQVLGFSGSLFTAEGHVTYIQIRPKEELRFQTALEQIGPPESYEARSIFGERLGVNLRWFYEEDGIILDAGLWGESPPSDCIYRLSSSTKVQDIVLLPPGTAEEMSQYWPRSNYSPSSVISTWQDASYIQLVPCRVVQPETLTLTDVPRPLIEPEEESGAPVEW